MCYYAILNKMPINTSNTQPINLPTNNKVDFSESYRLEKYKPRLTTTVKHHNLQQTDKCVCYGLKYIQKNCHRPINL